MKKYLGLIPIAIFAILLGCGGGGGGGGSTNGGGWPASDHGASVGSTVLGQFVDQNSDPIPGVTIRFYTGSGTLMGSAVSRANGYFDANIPSTASRFEVDGTTVSTFYQRTYRYNTKNYAAVGGGSTCGRILLPAITDGQLTPMAGPIMFYLGSYPPVFPTGCL